MREYINWALIAPQWNFLLGMKLPRGEGVITIVNY